MSRHPIVKRVNRWSRSLHRWGAIATLLPLGVIILTGILLQLKKDWSWVQPPTASGAGERPSISFDQILAMTAAQPEAAVSDWSDIDRLDVRPGDGVVKVRANNSWEIQIDTETGEVLEIAYRRSDLIESIHDGSILGDPVKLGIFLPTAIVLLGLWVTGAYLWALPIVAKATGRRRRAAATPHTRGPGAR